MKRAAKVIGNIAFYGLVASIIFSVVSQQFIGQAWGWTMVSGESMKPALEHGDFTFIVPYFAGKSGLPQVGNIIAFEDSLGHKVVHRIVDTTGQGYITKGDANPDADQEGGQPPVTLARIHGTVLSLGGRVIRIPVLGSLALRVVSGGVRLAVIIGVLTAVGVLLFLYFREGRRRRPRLRLKLRPEGGFKGLYSRHKTVFKYSGITVIGALILMSAMVRMSSTMDFCYGVSQARQSQPMGTSGGVSFGVIPVGSEQSRDLPLTSNFPITMVTIFVAGDDALTFPQNPAVIPPRQGMEVEALVTGREDNIGTHTTPVTMLVLPPVLPGRALYWLAQYHQLLAMFATSVVLMLALTVPAGFAEHRLGRERRSQMIRRLRQRRQE
jgi:signal peptidase I